MNDQQSVLEFVMEAAEVLLKNGAEVSRTQQTMEIMAKSLGVDSFHGYVPVSYTHLDVYKRQVMRAAPRF